MPIVEKKDMLMDAINVAAAARSWNEKVKKKRLIQHIKKLTEDFEQKSGTTTSSIRCANVVIDDATHDVEANVEDTIQKTFEQNGPIGPPSLLSKLARWQDTTAIRHKVISHKMKLQNFTSSTLADIIHGGTSSVPRWAARTLLKCSLAAFDVKESRWFTYFRHFLTVLCYIDSVVACDRQQLEANGDFPSWSVSLDFFVNYGFVVLGVVRLFVFPLFLAYGEHCSPIDYFIWLFRKSGIFDIAIGVICIVCLSDSTIGRWMRLCRVTVISITLVDSVDSLDVLLSGIWNGARSIKYSLAVMLVTTLAWCVVCNKVFGANDPYHFGGIMTSILSLVEIMTLDNWQEVIDLNDKGCGHTFYETAYDVYTPFVDCYNNSSCDVASLSTDLVGYNITFEKEANLGFFGVWSLPYCSPNDGLSWEISVLAYMIFISYIIVTAIVLWNLNTAAVTSGISEKMEQLKDESKRGVLLSENAEAKSRTLASTGAVAKHVDHFSSNLMSCRSINSTGLSFNNEFLRHNKKLDITRMRILLRNAWKEDHTFVISQTRNEHLAVHQACSDKKSLHYWLVVGNYTVAACVHTQWYVVFMDCCTVLVAVFTLSFRSDHNGTGRIESWIEALIQTLFTVDVLITALAAYPTMKSFTYWDVTDTLITLFTWPLVIPVVASNNVGSVLHAFRVLKCLRILDQFQDVHTIFRSLSSSAVAFLYVFVLLLLILIHFAMAASYLFRHNDPQHFRSILPSVHTMFQMITLDDWASISRHNIIGCDRSIAFFDYKVEDCTCGGMTPEGHEIKECGFGWMAALFFVAFIIIVVMIFMNLLIAIIIASMEMLRESMIHEANMWKKVEGRMEEYNLTKTYANSLLKVFDMLDVEFNGKLSLDEVRPILELVSGQEETQMRIFHEVDRDGSGSIDFAEFCELVHLFKLSHDFIKQQKQNGVKQTTAKKMEEMLHQSDLSSQEGNTVRRKPSLGTAGKNLTWFFAERDEYSKSGKTGPIQNDSEGSSSVRLRSQNKLAVSELNEEGGEIGIESDDGL